MNIVLPAQCGGSRRGGRDCHETLGWVISRSQVWLKDAKHMFDNVLVGGFNHIEKYESQWGGLSHILIMEHKKCLKPPTRCKMNVVQSVSGLVRLNVFDISNNKITVFRLIPTLTNYSVIVWFLTYQLETYMECIFWNYIWHHFWHFIWHIFWHSIWHVFWHSLWNLPGTLSGIHSDTFSGILSGMCSGILSDTLYLRV